MKEQFRQKAIRDKIKITLDRGGTWEASASDIIHQADAIIEEYQQQRIRMTLRQLYYQLVARDYIPNDQKVYKRLSSLLTDARYAGQIDWYGIEDRTRTSSMPPDWNSILDIVESAKASFRLPRWKGQKYHVELITEKQALESILAPIARRWHIRLTINRGYCSASTMKLLADRLETQIVKHKRPVILCYLGDYDPSGLDMVRDIEERVTEFLTEGVMYIEPEFEMVPVALTRGQIDTYDPPPNPAKITDPRFKWYIEKHGATSWEVDALRPEVMVDLVDTAIRQYVDVDMMDAIKFREGTLLKSLENFAAELEQEQRKERINGN